MTERETTVLDYILVLLKWKKFVFLFTVLTVIFTAGITFLLPKWYNATAVILIPPNQTASNLGGLFSQISSTLPSVPLMGDFLGVNSDSENFMAILKSRVAQEYVAKKFDLQMQYDAKNLEETIRELRSNFSFEETKEGAIEISVEDKSPVRASEMANAYVYFLDSLNINFQTEQARNNRSFIQERYNQTYFELIAAEDTLESFQESNKIISLPEQLQAEIQSYAELKGELAMKEIELESRSNFIGEDHPDIQLLQSQVTSIYNQMSQFEKKSSKINDAGNNTEFVVPFAEIPQIGAEYLRLQREIEIKSILYALLSQQLEQAKIKESRDTPTLLILDEAVPPIRKTKPKRLTLTLIFGGLAFILSTGIAFIFERYNSLRIISPHEHRKLVAIKNLLNKNNQLDD